MLQYLSSIQESFRLAFDTYREWWYLLVPALLSILAVDSWKNYVKSRYFQDMDYVFLSVNVPAELEKSPKVMEQFLTSMFGLQSSGSWSDRFWKGRQQVYLSFEMVGIGGLARFIVRVPKQYRDYVEAQLYAEYPEAEITEVEDYTQNLTWEKIDGNYDFFAAEHQKAKEPQAIPIRTYVDFEHSLTQQILDPMANLAETLTQLRDGENFWVQILAAPTAPGGAWYKAGLKEVQKAMKRKEPEPKIIPEIPIVTDLVNETASILSGIPAAVMGAEPSKPKKENPLAQQDFTFMSPGERTTLEAIERNLAKPGFHCKVRFIYTAPKGQSRMDSIVTAFFGVFWQYGTQNLNGFAPAKKHWTKVDYFFPKFRVHYRAKRLFHRFIHREFHAGSEPFILTTEELATIYHFPTISVQAPNLQRIESRKGEPPANLPVV